MLDAIDELGIEDEEDELNQFISAIPVSGTRIGQDAETQITTILEGDKIRLIRNVNQNVSLVLNSDETYSVLIIQDGVSNIITINNGSSSVIRIRQESGWRNIILYLLLIITFVYGLISNLSFVETLKLKTFDVLVKEHKPSEYFTILNITDSDVRERGGYPFPRQDLAEIQTELFNNGAIGVGWVISFIDEDRFGGDDTFFRINL